MGFPPTEEQQRIIDAAVAHEQIWVNAGAGTGKTATLQRMAEAMPKTTMTYLAFNAAIKQEASTRFPPKNVKCYTTHGLALRTNFDEWQRKMRLRTGSKRGRDIARQARILSGYRSEHADFSPADIGALAWSMVERYCSSADPEIGWWHLSKSHVDGVEDDERRHLGRMIGKYADAIWANLLGNNPSYPYGHSHYRKEWALTQPQIPTDKILVDEAQDLPPVVLGVLLEQKNAMVIPVGDRYQAINGFTGAIDALDRFNGTELRLTQSFRFGPAVAEVANEFLDALGTDMRIKGYDKINSVIGECPDPDAILCRTNSGAMTEVFKALDAGKRVALQGDGTEMADLANAAIQLQAGHRPDHRDLRNFANWGEVQDYVDKEPAGADLKTFVGLVDREGAHEILAALNNLVKTRTAPQKREAHLRRGLQAKAPVKADVIISTAHKAKGLEFPSVRTGDDFPSAKTTVGADAETPTINKDELMLAYVAATRATKRLDPAGIRAVLA